MLKVYKLEYKSQVVGYRICFEERYFDVSLEALVDEDSETYLVDSYKRVVSKGKGIEVLQMLTDKDGLLKTKDEIEGKIKVPIVSIEDTESEEGFEDRMWMFTIYDRVIEEIEAKEEESNKQELNYTDVLKMLKSTIKEYKTVVKCGMWYDEDCIKYGDYLYRVAMDIRDNKLNSIEFDLNYDIEKYARASFIKEVEDYDGWYKEIDTNHIAYKSCLEGYDKDRLRIRGNDLYEVRDDSCLVLEDKDWLTYVHTLRIKFKNPMPITEDNIRKLLLEFS